jgi:hypothetical protein
MAPFHRQKRIGENNRCYISELLLILSDIFIIVKQKKWLARSAEEVLRYSKKENGVTKKVFRGRDSDHMITVPRFVALSTCVNNTGFV